MKGNSDMMVDQHTLGLIESILTDGYVGYAKRIFNEIEHPATREAAQALFDAHESKQND